MRRTHQGMLVARELLSAPNERHWGYGLCQRTGLRSGVMYPILGRMLAAGWLNAANSEANSEANIEGRPARRYYFVTPAGRAALVDYVEEK